MNELVTWSFDEKQPIDDVILKDYAKNPQGLGYNLGEYLRDVIAAIQGKKARSRGRFGGPQVAGARSRPFTSRSKPIPTFRFGFRPSKCKLGSGVMNTYKIYENVLLGHGSVVEDFCIVGTPPRNVKDGELQTTIGEGAVIRSHTVIYAGNVIGRNFQTGNKVNIRESNHIGNNVSIGTLSVIEHHVEIGDNVRIHTQVFIPEFSVLEEGCWIGPQRRVHQRQVPAFPWRQGPSARVPLIRKGAKIGANATLLPGVVIGENALVGAGAVVVQTSRQVRSLSAIPHA